VGRRKTPLENPKLTQEIVDFSKEPPTRADDVFCCLGTTIKKAGSQAAFRAVDYYAVLSLAKAGGARFFLVSSLGADARSAVFYSRVKGEIEASAAQLPFEAVFILRPSLLLGDRGEFRLKEKIAEAAMFLLKPFLLGPLRKYRAIEAEVVAKAMLALARSGRKGVNILESDEIQALGGV
jgi:uncharacterized protein YbjT (DUF2867 family)